MREFIDGLSATDAESVVVEMSLVSRNGLAAARKLSGEIYEVRIDGNHQIFRVLFAEEGSKGRVLLALEGFSKKTPKTPVDLLRLAERRLADWRDQARSHP